MNELKSICRSLEEILQLNGCCHCEVKYRIKASEITVSSVGENTVCKFSCGFSGTHFCIKWGLSLHVEIKLLYFGGPEWHNGTKWL